MFPRLKPWAIFKIECDNSIFDPARFFLNLVGILNQKIPLNLNFPKVETLGYIYNIITKH